MSATRFILVRHGHTEAVGHRLAGRAPGSNLTAEGAEQAVRVALRLSSEVISGVFSSPRLRARQTAAQIADTTGCVVEENAALDEVDFGTWTGTDFDTLRDAPGWAEWNALRSLSPTPGGETMLQVQARAVGLLQTLHRERPGASLVLVSHADVLRSMLAYLLGQPIDLMRRLALCPGSISVAILGETDIRIDAINLRPSVR